MSAFSFAIFFKSAALVAFSLVAVSDGCSLKNDCGVNQVCCEYRCVYASSCVGRYCISDTGCSSGESCCANECVYGSSCVNRSCTRFESDCSRGESCCNSKCVYGSSCVGQSCSSASDCSIDQSCCNSECKNGYHCVGSSCSTDSDCGTLDTCCNGKCQRSYDDCIDFTAAVIAGAVIGPLALICAISMCFFYVRRRQRALSYGRVIEVERAVIPATVTTTVANIQSNPPFPGQEIPPSYPCHPPLELQFERLQHTTNPPAYNSGTTAAREQPPPYTEAPKGGSGGFDAPSTSFSSAPPVLQQH
ncbi:hypothetical protein ACROYT_G018422 [Oculina patagonica]